MDWSTHDGWLMDLYNHGNTSLGNRGERVDADPLLRNGRIIFVTTLPNDSACSFGGDSFLMELDADDGSRLAVSPFDLNNDRTFSSADYVTVTINNQQVSIPVSGRMSREGIIQQPGVLVSRGVEYKYASGSAGGIDITIENPGESDPGRQSWRQLR
jgi:type IV pilus assembly protein PilY1